VLVTSIKIVPTSLDAWKSGWWHANHKLNLAVAFSEVVVNVAGVRIFDDGELTGLDNLGMPG
jgi:hypothetical protein